MGKTAVILAGGDGVRAGGNEPKQFREICGKPMLYWSIKAFADEDRQTRVLVVIHPGFREKWSGKLVEISNELGVKCEMVCGGKSRFHSVYNALIRLEPEKGDLIAVHDAARPLLSSDLVARGWEAGKENGAAVPVIPLTDSMRRLLPDGSESVVRKDYVAVQTPQVFETLILKSSYSCGERPEFTDDASVVEAFGHDVALYPGDERNIKVTHPFDFAVVETLMKYRDNNR